MDTENQSAFGQSELEELNRLRQEKAARELEEANHLDQSKVFPVKNFREKKEYKLRLKQEWQGHYAQACKQELSDIFNKLDPNKKGKDKYSAGELKNALISKIHAHQKSINFNFRVTMFYANFFGEPVDGMLVDYTKNVDAHKITIELSYPNCVVGNEINPQSGHVIRNKRWFDGVAEAEPFAVRLSFTRSSVGL
jgi:hypothetical protein